jgi:hypothetical protein
MTDPLPLEPGTRNYRGDYRALAIRAFFMLVYCVLYSVIEAVLVAVSVLQFGFAAILGTPNTRLARFGSQLARFSYQIIRFWTFNTEQKPFPFSDWPSSEPLP